MAVAGVTFVFVLFVVFSLRAVCEPFSDLFCDSTPVEKQYIHILHNNTLYLWLGWQILCSSAYSPTPLPMALHNCATDLIAFSLSISNGR